jgi:hypothetical protein
MGKLKNLMLSRSGISKLKAFLIIDLLIVAIAAGIYLYLQNTGQLVAESESTEFTVTNLTINPLEAEIGESITISANLTNVGQIEGSYTVNLTINDIPKGNQTILLSSGENRIVEFTDAENTEGNYTVKIGDLTGSFMIRPPAPTTGKIILSDLLFTPYEANVGSTVNIKVTAKNSGTEAESLLVKLTIDDILADSKTVKLGEGETTTVEFTINVTSEGTHKIKVNTLSGSFKAVPEGMHTLSILISPVPKGGTGDFKLNGEGKRTPYSALLPEGTYTVTMPPTDPTGEYAFLHWENGELNPVRTITLTEATLLVAYFEFATSCPSLYIWNGTSYVYVADISNHGWLGYINYINEDGSIVFWRNNPWDYIPLDKSQLQPINGYYDLTLVQKWNEIFYLDSAYMVAIDHPSDVNVYSTMVEQYLDSDFMGQIYTVSKNPSTPISAVNEKGEDVLPQISKMDGTFTTGTNGINSADWDDISWNTLTLNLGDLSNAPEIKLVVKAIVDWGSGEDYVTWLDKFFAAVDAGVLPNGTQITPPPYMEVKAANGSWVRVPESRQIPLPPDGVARTFVVDLTGLFPADDYSLRINNFWNVTFDYIGVDTTPQRNVTIQRIDPYATLYQAYDSPSLSSGNFTRYGDVNELVRNGDDEFVIGRQGDAVSLLFPTFNMTPLPENMERDFFFFDSSWFKDEDGNWGFGFGFTVDPLPFQTMSGFPYPLETEHYPDDPEHVSYLQEWNTRIVNPP